MDTVSPYSPHLQLIYYKNVVYYKAWIEEVSPRISNLESWIQESLQSLQIFGKCLRVYVCVCLPRFVGSTHMPVYMYTCLFI